MTDDLLKSVREVKACEKCIKSYHEDTKAILNASCDACLRLVLAHCGERYILLTKLVRDDYEREVAAAIRRAFCP